MKICLFTKEENKRKVEEEKRKETLWLEVYKFRYLVKKNQIFSYFS
jgi:hypothetical protein